MMTNPMVEKEGLHASEPKHKIVAITGASSGIGRATAIELARQGAKLILISRQKEALEKLANECSKKFGSEILIAPADTSDAKAIQGVVKRSIEKFGHIDVWINNAAVLLFGLIEEIPLADIRKVLETNLFGYVHGARAVLPYFREQGHGTLINISSVVGKTGQAFSSPYVISKFGIAGLSEALRQDLMDQKDIHVVTVFPASTDTPFYHHAANFTGRAIKPLIPINSAETVAKAIVKSIKYPRHTVFAGTSARGASIFHALFPSLYDRRFANQVRRQHFQDRPEAPKHGNLFEPDTSLNNVNGGWKQEAKRTFPTTALTLLGLAAISSIYYLIWKPRPEYKWRP